MDDVLYQEVDSPKADVKIPATEESLKFADKLSSPKGIAEFILGKTAIDAGRSLVVKSMRSFGYENVQVAIADVNNDAVIYSVAVDGGAGFKVPVKVKGGLPEAPTVLVAAGEVGSFSKEGVSKALIGGDYHAAINTSPLYGLKPSELIENIRKATAENDYVTAEDALNVLSNSDDKKAFEYGFAIYHNALNGKALHKEASKETSCSMPIKNAHSKHVLCGHTGLPVHKVYQDDNGQCLPLYRKDIDHSNEGGSFLHSRIHWG